MRTLLVRPLTATAALLITAGLTGSAAAQTPAPAAERWAPFLGCWQLVNESTRDALPADPTSTSPAWPTSSGPRVCVSPGPDAASATFTTLVNDRAVLTETIAASGTSVALNETDCRGWQEATWSPLSPRLYSRAQVTCANQPTRTVSSLSMMLAGPVWIDVQLITTDGGRKSLRARRYHRAANQVSATGPAIAPAAVAPLPRRLSIADVKEAVGRLEPEVVEAALAEVRNGFDLNGRALRDLGEAGVPARVIDLMVALTFPERFVVDRPSSSGWASGGGAWDPYDYGFDPMWAYFGNPFLYSSLYAPFGYRYWGGYDPYYFSGPGFVVINPDTVEPQPSGNGRVVDGQGYTRVRRVQPEPASRTNGVGSRGETASQAGSSGSSSGSGSSGASSSGYSSGGSSSGGSGRTAVPRPPGGN